MRSADADRLRQSAAPLVGKQEVATHDLVASHSTMWNQWLAAKQNLRHDIERCLRSQEEIIVQLLNTSRADECPRADECTLVMNVPAHTLNGQGTDTLVTEIDVVDLGESSEAWASPAEIPGIPTKIGSLPGAPTEPPPTVALQNHQEDTTNTDADPSTIEEPPKKVPLRDSLRGGHGLDDEGRHCPKKITVTDIISSKIETYMKQWKPSEEPERSGRLHAIETSNWFNTLCPMVILTDAGYTTWSADRSAASPELGTTSTMQIIELCFTAFYLSELILKLLVHRKYHFYNAQMYWNWFDLILVAQSLFDVILTYVVSSGGGSATFMRLLRLMKLGKILRLFRAVRFLRDLSVMIIAIMNCMSALFWAFNVLALVLYVFALMMVQSMTGWVQEEIEKPGGISPEIEEKVNLYFSSVGKTTLYLFMCATGGINWIDMFNTVEHGGGLVACAFIFFIGFFGFAVITILSGIFIEKALVAAQPDRESMALEQRRLEDQEALEMKDLLLSMDKDNSRTLTLQEFVDASEDMYVKAYLRSLGLDIHDAVMFFNLLSSLAGTEELPLEDFLKKLGRMKGSATAMDLQSLMFEVSILRKQFESFMHGDTSKVQRFSQLDNGGQVFSTKSLKNTIA